MIGDVAQLGVVGLANAYRSDQLSAETAVAWYLDRIKQHNPKLNAFVRVFEKSAMESARAADARRAQGQVLSGLDGIPVGLKDNVDVAGTVTSNGVGALRNRLAGSTAFAAARLDEMGCVVLGKLNMDEAALGATTNNPHFGRTDNPRRAGDTPGGSSGGSGAAVAAGLCAAALGTDTLGSVRIPAAYCGVVGLLGSRGMVSRTGVHALSNSLDQVGVLAGNVVDAVAVYSAICGYDPQDEQSLPSSDRFGATLSAVGTSKDSARLHLGFIDVSNSCDGPNAKAIVQRMHQLAERLRSEGHRIDRPIPSPVDYVALRRAALLVIEAEGFQACAAWLHDEGVSPQLQRMLAYGARQPASHIEAARAELRAARLSWRALCAKYDLLVMPTAPQTSFMADADVPVSQANFTTPASVAGMPAISLPAGYAADGRAFSLQLIGPGRSETRLLRFAQHIQEQVIE